MNQNSERELSANLNFLFPLEGLSSCTMVRDHPRLHKSCLHSYPVKKAIEFLKIHSPKRGQHGKLESPRLDLPSFSSSTIEPITEEFAHPKLVSSGLCNLNPKNEGFE